MLRNWCRFMQLVKYQTRLDASSAGSAFLLRLVQCLTHTRLSFTISWTNCESDMDSASSSVINVNTVAKERVLFFPPTSPTSPSPGSVQQIFSQWMPNGWLTLEVFSRSSSLGPLISLTSPDHSVYRHLIILYPLLVLTVQCGCFVFPNKWYLVFPMVPSPVPRM